RRAVGPYRCPGRRRQKRGALQDVARCCRSPGSCQGVASSREAQGDAGGNCNSATRHEHAAALSSSIMGGNAGSRNRFIKDGHLINLPGEEVSGTVENTATADVDIEGRSTIVHRRGTTGCLEHTVVIGLEGGSIGNGSDMVPLAVRERVCRVQ